MAATKILLTAEEFDNYPFEEDKRYELDEGELIEVTRPAYKHNRAMKNIVFELLLYFKANPIGELLLSENLYAISPITRLSPDVGVILGDRQAELEDAKVIQIIPEIAVEVLSPSERPRMIMRKLRHYFGAGVKEVWIVNPETQTTEVWTSLDPPETELALNDSITSPLLPGFSLPLAQVFA